MALEAALQQLCAQLLALREAYSSLRTTIREDKPLQDDVVLVDVFGDAADDQIGLLDEALTAIGDALAAAGEPVALVHLRRALLSCHERCGDVARRYWGDLFGYARLRELRRFGRRRGGEWRAWATGVRRALAACEEPLWAIDRELLGCWQELTERLALPPLAVEATLMEPALRRREVEA